MARSSTRRPVEPPPADRLFDIESLDLDANGVARADGKVVFVRGALPGERVRASIVRSKPKFDVAATAEVLRESPLRVVPRCPHFGVCGGCSMQHMEARGQLSIKQRVLEDQFVHLAGGLRPETVLRPLAGPSWGYRQRARLSVRHVEKKGGVLVGFHERGSSYVADMRECHVLPPRLSALLLPMRELVAGLSIRDRMPQIEVAIGDDVLALVFRVIEPPSDADRRALTAFARLHDLEVWLQPKGPDTIVLLADGRADSAPSTPASSTPPLSTSVPSTSVPSTPGPSTPGPSTPVPSTPVASTPSASTPFASTPPAPVSRLAYTLPEFDVRMPFRPTDFTQVNHDVNRALVGRAIRLLDCQPGETVADLFCGLGNFTLPLARRVGGEGRVLGIEGSATLTTRATDNASVNGLQDRVEFRTANLFDMTPAAWRELGAFDRVLIDPPREGALEVVKGIAADPHAPRRIVYVSCNPATLARDAAVLVHTGGYRLVAAGAINMFPHTSHVESIAVFEPAAGRAAAQAEAA
ncbi:MAG: methyltransferase domain-containing protein [Burkholderiaceae bacterium]